MTSDLSATDQRNLLAAAELVAASESLEELRLRTVEILPTLVDTIQVAWNEVDLAGGSIAAVMAPDLDAALTDELDAAFIAHVGDHPVIAHHARTGDGRPHAISDFLDVDAFHATAIYQRFYRRLGAEDQLSFMLPDPLLLIGIALNRPERGFSERDRRICNLLRPHLLQAHRTVEALGRVQRLLATLDRIAVEQGEELVVVGRRGTVDYVTPGARQLLLRFFGTVDPEALSGRFTAAAADAAAGTVTYRRESRVLQARRVPMEDGHAFLLREHQAGAGPASLRRIGLTTREAEVMDLVSRGMSTKRIASALKVSPRTVDKHVGHSLDKLGVSSRLAAVQLLGGLNHGD